MQSTYWTLSEVKWSVVEISELTRLSDEIKHRLSVYWVNVSVTLSRASFLTMILGADFASMNSSESQVEVPR